MLRAVAICPEQELTSELAWVLDKLGTIRIDPTPARYPTEEEFIRYLLARPPAMVFVSPHQTEAMESIFRVMKIHSPGVPVIAFARHADPDSIVKLVRLGAADFLIHPFDDANDVLPKLVERISEEMDHAERVRGLLYSFLPAKAGCGASTLAYNAAVAASRRTSDPTLLFDCDLNTGMIQYMSKSERLNSLITAVQRAGELNDTIWPQMVSQVEKLDVLHAGGLHPNMRIELAPLQYLMSYLRRRYKVLAADLSGNLERYSLEVMQQSRAIFLVTTPEPANVYHAREKLRFLRELNLEDRVKLIVNRSFRNQFLRPEQIEDHVGVSVHTSFPNDYVRVQKSLVSGEPIDAKSDLGRKFDGLAAYMLHEEPSEEAKRGRKYLEFFALSHLKA